MKSVKVSDYMARKLVTFHQRDNVVEAMAVLLDRKISGAPVVDDDGNLVGVLSEVDLMEIVIQDSYYDESMGIVRLHEDQRGRGGSGYRHLLTRGAVPQGAPAPLSGGEKRQAARADFEARRPAGRRGLSHAHRAEKAQLAVKFICVGV